MGVSGAFHVVLVVKNLPANAGDVRVGPYSKLSAKELMLFNCGAGEDS